MPAVELLLRRYVRPFLIPFLTFLLLLTIVPPPVSSVDAAVPGMGAPAAAAAPDGTGRWKSDGNGGCYWDPYDEGPDQCDPNAPPPSGGGVTFFDDIYFGGASFSSGASMSFVGWDWNDRVSSISVPSGMSVTIYEHSDFGGASLTLSAGDTVDLRNYGGPGPDGTWNDSVSSFVIGGTPPPPPPPPPTPQRFVLLVNGSFAQSPAGWTAIGSPEWNAIAATFGVSPQAWPWTTNGFWDVTAPNYSGIWQGGHDLANFLATLPAAEVNIVSHSHGGNVVLASQAWSSRRIRRYIQLATPVNWDFGGWRYALGYTVDGRCQVSSDADWVQFFGASPGQITNFAIALYLQHAGAQEAYDALMRRDYEEAFAWFAEAAFAAYLADYWFWTTKDEVEGGNLTFYGYGLGHSQMHEPPVWNAIAPYCR